MAQGPDGAGFKRGYRATPSLYAPAPAEHTSAEQGADVTAAAVQTEQDVVETEQNAVETEQAEGPGGDGDDQQ